MNEWSKPVGQQVLSHLARLYRALVWEGFILLAVAAKDERTDKTEEEKAATGGEPASEKMEESESGKGAGSTQTTEVSMDTSNSAIASGQEGDGMETSESDKRTPGDRSGTPEPTSKLRPHPVEIKPNVLIQSLKQLPPLFTITSHVGRSLAELLSFLVKVSTSPLHRPHRRGAGFLISHYQPPSEEAINVCSEVTDLLLDSLKWEVPMPEMCHSAMQSPIRDWLFGG